MTWPCSQSSWRNITAISRREKTLRDRAIELKNKVPLYVQARAGRDATEISESSHARIRPRSLVSIRNGVDSQSGDVAARYSLKHYLNCSTLPLSRTAADVPLPWRCPLRTSTDALHFNVSRSSASSSRAQPSSL
jgi:hypothetical protein